MSNINENKEVGICTKIYLLNFRVGSHIKWANKLFLFVVKIIVIIIIWIKIVPITECSEQKN